MIVVCFGNLFDFQPVQVVVYKWLGWQCVSVLESYALFKWKPAILGNLFHMIYCWEYVIQKQFHFWFFSVVYIFLSKRSCHCHLRQLPAPQEVLKIGQISVSTHQWFYVIPLHCCGKIFIIINASKISFKRWSCLLLTFTPFCYYYPHEIHSPRSKRFKP